MNVGHGGMIIPGTIGTALWTSRITTNVIKDLRSLSTAWNPSVGYSNDKEVFLTWSTGSNREGAFAPIVRECLFRRELRNVDVIGELGANELVRIVCITSAETKHEQTYSLTTADILQHLNEEPLHLLQLVISTLASELVTNNIPNLIDQVMELVAFAGGDTNPFSAWLHVRSQSPVTFKNVGDVQSASFIWPWASVPFNSMGPIMCQGNLSQTGWL